MILLHVQPSGKDTFVFKGIRMWTLAFCFYYLFSYECLCLPHMSQYNSCSAVLSNSTYIQYI